MDLAWNEAAIAIFVRVRVYNASKLLLACCFISFMVGVKLEQRNPSLASNMLKQLVYLNWASGPERLLRGVENGSIARNQQAQAQSLQHTGIPIFT